MTRSSIEVFFDYTCDDSFRVSRILRAVEEDVTWRTMSLKRIKQHDAEASVLDDETMSSFSILALALAHAVPEGQFESFHYELFDRMHAEPRLSVDDLYELARRSGANVGAFDADKTRWLDAVRSDHEDGLKTWNAIGTPTVVIDQSTAVYFKTNDFDQGREEDVWQAFKAAALSPYVREIKRSF